MDNADLAPPNARPEAQAGAPAACFFVHGTTSASRSGWNEPPGDVAADGYTDRDVLPWQAGAFNAACAVYAPRYRQAHLVAFVDADGAAALDVAYDDVARAFAEFLRRFGPDQPFVLAGHSQGSALLLRLLVDQVSGTPRPERLVATYLPGWMSTTPCSTAAFGRTRWRASGRGARRDRGQGLEPPWMSVGQGPSSAE